MEPLFFGIFVAVGLVRLGVLLFRERGEVRLEDRALRVLTLQARRLDAIAIANAKDTSLSRIVGRVRATERELASPVAKLRCVWWCLRVEVLEYAPERRATIWRPFTELSDSCEFVVTDSGSECSVDPALASVSIEKQTRYKFRPGSAPSHLKEWLEHHGVSTHDLDRRTWAISESAIAIGSTVGVAGVPLAVERPVTTMGESDYRGTRPPSLRFGGNQNDLLISTHRPLLQQRASARMATAEWGLPSVAASGSAMASVPVDDFEETLKRSRMLRLIGTTATGAVVIAAAFGAIHSWSHGSEPMSPAHEQAIAEAIVRTRADLNKPTCGAPDGCWGRELSRRSKYRRGDRDCAYRVLFEQRIASPRATGTATPSNPSSRSPIAISVIHQGDAIPAHSPRTEMVRAKLDEITADLVSARDDDYASLLERAENTDEAVAVLVELPPSDAPTRGRVWAYDHGLDQIACMGEFLVGPDRSADTILARALPALRSAYLPEQSTPSTP